MDVTDLAGLVIVLKISQQPSLLVGGLGRAIDTNILGSILFFFFFISNKSNIIDEIKERKGKIKGVHNDEHRKEKT